MTAAQMKPLSAFMCFVKINCAALLKNYSPDEITEIKSQSRSRTGRSRCAN